MEDAFRTVAQNMNIRVSEDAVKLYQRLMDERLHLPAQNETEISNHHHYCWREAIREFRSKALFDDENTLCRDLAVSNMKDDCVLTENCLIV